MALNKGFLWVFHSFPQNSFVDKWWKSESGKKNSGFCLVNYLTNIVFHLKKLTKTG